MLAAILVGVVEFWASGAAVRAGPPPKLPLPPVRPGEGIDPRMPYFRVCSQTCDSCARSCNLCATHCLEHVARGKLDYLTALQACRDCATICATAAEVSSRDGPLADAICTACAAACERCQAICATWPDDPLLKQCVEVCKGCEATCREMAKLSRVARPVGKSGD